jgi:hypothetical protein
VPQAERQRLEEATHRLRHWRRWGPYLSERQWGTVREDYSSYGDAWNYFPFEHAHLRAYRWGEDGLLGFSDNHQRLCLSIALWNERDAILRERLFGLANGQGNHGEDVKEVYYYLDSTPTHSWATALYKYPHAAFPYDELRRRNRRGLNEPEFELHDTGIFHESRYFDVLAEYAKAGPNDLLLRITITNRGPEAAPFHLLPQLWFRNRWSWGRRNRQEPVLRQSAPGRIELEERHLGRWTCAWENEPTLLFTGNESNRSALWGDAPTPGFWKDAFHRRVVQGEETAAWYQGVLAPGASASFRLRLCENEAKPWTEFEPVLLARRQEADEFYASVQPASLSADARNVQRQAFAGLLWTKQYYHYVIEDWLQGDPASPPPPAPRKQGRNHHWRHFFTDDILSMPDKWEYPWFAAWDHAFHMVPYALIDAPFAKHQLSVLLREWYMHPNGQIPAYEWKFEDVNPPVHAWACWRVFKIDAKQTCQPDIRFLESAFHKLLLNFTWWVNRKDSAGGNIFEGGFLGLDNIGVFDRSRPLPGGYRLEQSDATSWMAMYSLNMLRIAIELAQHNSAYEDIASKFFEHFLYIASAMNTLGGDGLWDEKDGFFYDRILTPGGGSVPLRVRSLVGLIPLFAVEVLNTAHVGHLKGFVKRVEWFLAHRPDLCANLYLVVDSPGQSRGLFSLVTQERLRRLLQVMLDENEFLSPYGIRSLSRHHAANPYVFHFQEGESRVAYTPGDSDSRMFGGNSNWRGPVWFPTNYLLIESLQRFHHFLGPNFQVEYPTGSGKRMNLQEVAADLSRRLCRLFLRDAQGRRPANNALDLFDRDPHFRDHVLFHEFFHGDNGAGLGASHQTGWTALVAKLLQQTPL